MVGAVRAADVDEGADDKSLVLVLVMFQRDRLIAVEEKARYWREGKGKWIKKTKARRSGIGLQSM